MKKVLPQYSLINPNQHKIIATKLDNVEQSVAFHLKILEKCIEKFNTANSITQKLLHFNNLLQIQELLEMP